LVSVKNSKALPLIVRGSTNERELLPCGSKSSSKTFFPFKAQAAERLMAVVDFPTPPFWLAITIIIQKKK
jgi:hypothetical protein